MTIPTIRFLRISETSEISRAQTWVDLLAPLIQGQFETAEYNTIKNVCRVDLLSPKFSESIVRIAGYRFFSSELVENA